MISALGGIGRRIRFKPCRLRECEFESRSAHQEVYNVWYCQPLLETKWWLAKDKDGWLYYTPRQVHAFGFLSKQEALNAVPKYDGSNGIKSRVGVIVGSP